MTTTPYPITSWEKKGISPKSKRTIVVSPKKSRKRPLIFMERPMSLHPEYRTANPIVSMTNFPSAAASGRTHIYSSTGSIGTAAGNTNATVSPVSPKGKRKRIHTQELSSSPGSAEDGYEGNGDKRRPPGVKRACNECRQQKVRRPRTGGSTDNIIPTHSLTATLQCYHRAYIPIMWAMSTSRSFMQDRLELQESRKAEHEC